jgi:transcriptional regulator with XRE-family HTH domain
MDNFYKKLGARIKKLREVLEFSQETLAKEIGISRVSLSQVENGAREVSAEELDKISKIFNITMEVLLDQNKEINVEILTSKNDQSKTELKQEVRISVPQKNLAKFKEILLYILSKTAGKPNVGETVIYKLLYFMDFDYYEKYEEQLIGATYIKNHFGPTPKEFKKIVDKMILDHDLIKIADKYFKHPQTKYLPLRNPNLSIISAREKELIDDVLTRLSDKNAKELSNYSHGDMPWLSHKDGEIISYESVFYRDEKYSVRNYEDEI